MIGESGVYSAQPIYKGGIHAPVLKQAQSAFNHTQHLLHHPGHYSGYHMQVAETASDMAIDLGNAAARALVVYSLLKMAKVKVKFSFFIYFIAADIALAQVLPKQTPSDTYIASSY